MIGALALLWLTALTVSPAEAASINKCVLDGKVTFQQGPCATGQIRPQPSVAELNAAEKKRRAEAAAAASSGPGPEPTASPPAIVPGPSFTFSCDGRRKCPQMRSCEEAKYFLAHCPGVDMDGDRDGIPCEQQWCGGERPSEGHRRRGRIRPG